MALRRWYGLVDELRRLDVGRAAGHRIGLCLGRFPGPDRHGCGRTWAWSIGRQTRDRPRAMSRTLAAGRRWIGAFRPAVVGAFLSLCRARLGPGRRLPGSSVGSLPHVLDGSPVFRNPKAETGTPTPLVIPLCEDFSDFSFLILSPASIKNPRGGGSHLWQKNC